MHWERTYALIVREEENQALSVLTFIPMHTLNLQSSYLLQRGEEENANQAYYVCDHTVVLQVVSMCSSKAPHFYLHTWKESRMLFHLHIFLISWNYQLQRRLNKSFVC
jgi:hypothetical protein